MRRSPILMLAAAFGLASPALAQVVQNGLDVQVNPYAASGGSQTLLYPGGEFSRTVPRLLYPGQPSGPIRLHMPTRRHHATVASAEPSAPAEPVAPRPRHVPRPKPVKVAKAAPPPPPPPQPQQGAPVDNNNPYFGGPNLGNVFGAQPAPAPAPAPKAPPARKLASAAPPPVNNTPPANESGLTKRSVILFAKDASDPAEGALKSIGFLASDLNAAMTSQSSRVELQAYGGARGNKESDARRLSLKRALAIRQILINDGVSPDRIDVRAMGGVDDSGPADRVDVFVRA